MVARFFGSHGAKHWRKVAQLSPLICPISDRRVAVRGRKIFLSHAAKKYKYNCSRADPENCFGRGTLDLGRRRRRRETPKTFRGMSWNLEVGRGFIPSPVD